MGVYITTGDIVEGQKCYVVARRKEYKKGGLRKDPITQKKMTLYELDRNSSVEVVETLAMTTDEKQLRDSMNVHYQVGDKLDADAINLYVETNRNSLKFEVKEGVTGRHGANVVSSNRRTVGVIRMTKSMHNKFMQLPKAINNVELIDNK